MAWPFQPSRRFTSDGLTPAQAMRTRTSPAAGTGVSSSPACSTVRAGPVRSYQVASIVVAFQKKGCANRWAAYYWFRKFCQI